MTNNEIKIFAQEFDAKDINNIKNNGVVFTPLNIATQIIENIKPKITDKICEPSVGKGVFVFALIDYFLKNHTIYDVAKFINYNLYCFDINSDFIEDLKSKVIRYVCVNNSFDGMLTLDNFKCVDYLETSDSYDLIIGNPPYVKIHNIDKQKLDNYRIKYDSLSEGNVDLYYGFVEKSLSESKQVSFIIPNTFIKSKSGKILRTKLKDRVVYIQDFKTEKVWKNISTYTCIIRCDETNIKGIEYNGETFNIDELNKEIWTFNDLSGDNKLSDLINYSGIGIQTSADKYYITKKFDNKYAYINDYKIELDFCKKIIKATKSKKFEEFKYVIYPYDKDGAPLDEDFISANYPLAYGYLLSIKDELLKRNLNHDFWYIYGRNQGLIKSKIGTQIILPATFLKSRNVHYIEIPKYDESLVQNGILVDIDNLDSFITIITSDDFLTYLEQNNKTLPDKQGSSDLWLTLTANSLKNYKY